MANISEPHNQRGEDTEHKDYVSLSNELILTCSTKVPLEMEVVHAIHTHVTHTHTHNTYTTHTHNTLCRLGRCDEQMGVHECGSTSGQISWPESKSGEIAKQ